MTIYEIIAYFCYKKSSISMIHPRLITPDTVTNERYAALAHDILAIKRKPAYYRLEGEQWENEAEYSVMLTPDEVDFLSKLYDQYEKEYDGVFELYEMEEDIPFFDKFLVDFGFIPKYIDILKPQYYYKFTAILPYPEEKRDRTIEVSIPMSDDEYAKLLQWRLQNRDDSFNMLSVRKPGLYLSLTEHFIWALGTNGQPCPYPFYIRTDEVDEDVLKAVGESDFFDYLFEDMEHLCQVFVTIKEKVMIIVREDRHNYQELCGIDAIAFQDALGVSCYQDLFDKMKEKFGECMEAYDRIKDFLEESGIQFQIK